MKNIVWILASVCLFFSFVIMLLTKGVTTKNACDLLNIEALALIEELPEVEIICGQEEGKCWDGDCTGYSATPFGVYRSWDCHTFTGSQSDTCFNDMPC